MYTDFPFSNYYGGHNGLCKKFSNKTRGWISTILKVRKCVNILGYQLSRILLEQHQSQCWLCFGNSSSLDHPNDAFWRILPQYWKCGGLAYLDQVRHETWACCHVPGLRLVICRQSCFLIGQKWLLTHAHPWTRYISWFYYGYSALLVNQWSGVENISCPQKISETMGGTNMTGVETACLTTGDQVLATLSIHEVKYNFSSTYPQMESILCFYISIFLHFSQTLLETFCFWWPWLSCSEFWHSWLFWWGQEGSD